MLTKTELFSPAKAAGFHVNVLKPEEIRINPDFRTFCEENLCGRYNANYSCPPDCGTIEELHKKLLKEDFVLVVQMKKIGVDKKDKTQISAIKGDHNAAILKLMNEYRALGYDGFCAGYSGCSLCKPCKRLFQQPCAHPELRISCMSAYCVDVADTAKKCGLEFSWEPGNLFLFGMLALHRD